MQEPLDDLRRERGASGRTRELIRTLQPGAASRAELVPHVVIVDQTRRMLVELSPRPLQQRTNRRLR